MVKTGALSGLITSVGLAAITVCYIFLASQLPTSGETQTDLGPGPYPIFLGIILGILTVVLGIQSANILRRYSTSGKEDQKHNRRPVIVHRTWISIVLTVILTVVYLVVLNTLGFLIATAIYLIIETLIFRGQSLHGWRSLLAPVIFGVVVSSALYFVFVHLLGVLLPAGLMYGIIS